MRVMPFGTFRGTLLEDLEDWYVSWAVKQDWIREPLRSALYDEYERRQSEASTYTSSIDVNVAESIVTAGQRSLAKVWHPDVGGDTGSMQKVNQCVAWLRQQIKALL